MPLRPEPTDWESVFRSAKRDFAEPGRSALIDADAEKSELLANNRFTYVSVFTGSTRRTFSQLTEASFPEVSVARVLNVQQPKWTSNCWLRRRPNRFASEGERPSEEERGHSLRIELA